jgi:hypothetical protein
MTLFSLENLYQQYIACRRNKRNTANALRFEARQELNLLDLQEALVSRNYEPGRSVCFFIRRPKLREVFAADFRDRVVHHVLVSHLEKAWEKVFIHDSYACRKGKGVHAAVDRLQQFMRQATANGTRPAWYLQLDIRNYFMRIDKQRLFAMLDARLQPQRPQDAEARWLAHTLVFHDCTRAPIIRGDPALVERLPPHKTLFHAPPGKGLQIGNLNSQFFANVYLNALDQFVKHELRCRWYLRYCDDFCLLARSPEELQFHKARIEEFAKMHLDLRLNPTRERLQPVSDGVDFLGYIVRPFHLLVRRRVVGHLREALARSERLLVGRHARATEYRFDAPALDALQASLASYLGHLRRASCRRLVAAIRGANPWLAGFIELHRQSLKLRRRDKPLLAARTVQAQYRHWQREFAGDLVLMQVGAFVEQLQWPPRRIPKVRPATDPTPRGGLRRMRPTRRGAVRGFPMVQLARRVASMVAAGHAVTFVAQRGESGSGLMRRIPVARWVARSARAGANERPV